MQTIFTELFPFERVYIHLQLCGYELLVWFELPSQHYQPCPAETGYTLPLQTV